MSLLVNQGLRIGEIENIKLNEAVALKEKIEFVSKFLSDIIN